MEFSQAQQNMRFAYYGGAPGVLASGMVWSVAAAVALWGSAHASMLTLFIGGMVIHPLGMLVSKLLKRPGQHQRSNPLGRLAIESTMLLFIGLFLAFSVATLRIDWFYPIMLMTIGGRYLLFATLYGMRIYWLLGALLVLVGASCMLSVAPFYFAAYAGASIEIIFSFLLFYLAKVSSDD